MRKLWTGLQGLILGESYLHWMHPSLRQYLRLHSYPLHLCVSRADWDEVFDLRCWFPGMIRSVSRAEIPLHHYTPAPLKGFPDWNRTPCSFVPLSACQVSRGVGNQTMTCVCLTLARLLSIFSPLCLRVLWLHKSSGSVLWASVTGVISVRSCDLQEVGEVGKPEKIEEP